MTQPWFERQLLPPRRGVSIAEVVDRAGWIPSAGGTGPYLSIRARIPGINRQDIDDAVFERMEILELPSQYYTFDSSGTREKRVGFVKSGW